MIAALILAISVAALLQFFVSYCRSLTAAYGQLELSAEVREVTGIEGRNVHGEDFGKLVQLLRLCPEASEDGFEVRAVSSYFSLLRVVPFFTALIAPAVARWAEVERRSCAYFAAVALDRRIAYNRDLLAQQTKAF